ncbi:uL10 family ribosomal protein [Blastococcus deserti]|uniref:Uncharacterized protein n=1 Tax=Blastococcus deserti TaxID=2259033 RepID=A0ABW4XE46_9ACTN
MGATLGWPTMAVLGFLLLTGVVVALGMTSTARYEFERNGAREPRAAEARGYGGPATGGRSGRPSADATDAQARPAAVDLAVRPAPAAGGPGWWLVDESGQAVAGPFADAVDADWLALAEGLAAVSVFGTRGGDGSVAPRPSPEERAWLGELSDQLDRLPADWDALLSDTDPLTTLLVEVAAALVEAGLPLQDAAGPHPAGGVCLTPEGTFRGVLVSWRAHDRMSVHHKRGAAASATVQQSMNAAVADILWNLGFLVEPFGAAGGVLVTALR